MNFNCYPFLQAEITEPPFNVISGQFHGIELPLGASAFYPHWTGGGVRAMGPARSAFMTPSVSANTDVVPIRIMEDEVGHFKFIAKRDVICEFNTSCGQLIIDFPDIIYPDVAASCSGWPSPRSKLQTDSDSAASNQGKNGMILEPDTERQLAPIELDSFLHIRYRKCGRNLFHSRDSSLALLGSAPGQ